MTRKEISLAIVIVASIGAAPSMLAAGAGKILHEPIPCIPAAGHGRIEASLAPGVTASSVRVYFRGEGAKEEYYSEMRRNQPGRYWAVFPVAAAGQKAILYRVVARETEGEFAQTPSLRAPVVTGCPAVLTEEERRYAKNIVLGMTSADQGDSLTAFTCAGVVAKITASGDLRTLPSCIDGVATGSGAVASSSGTAVNVLSASSGAATTSSKPATGNAGLVIGGTQGTGAPVTGTPISSARPPR